MNKVEKIREEIEKRYEYWKEKESNSHSIESESRMSECQHLLLLFNSLQEEPVSNDLEKEIQRYYNEMDGDCRYMQTARHFARWQKEQMVEEACKWLELHDSYAVPTNIKVRDLKEHLSSK